MNVIRSLPLRMADLFFPETLDERICPMAKVSTSQGKREEPMNRRLMRLTNIFIDILLVVWMFRTAFKASGPENPSFENVYPLLSPGWLGPKVDNTDHQYAGFRSNFLIVLMITAGHLIMRRLLMLNSGNKRKYYDVITSVHVFGLHGTGGIKIFILLFLNYFVGKKFKSRTAAWIFAVGTLVVNEFTHGFRYFQGYEYGMLLPDWQIFFKCTVLRMLSFNIDYIEAEESQEKDTEVKISEREEMVRCLTPRAVGEYDLMNYIGYCLYLPLYIGGPIITFNDFRSQIEKPTLGTTLKRVVIYSIRFVFCLLVLEFLLHNIYAPAMIRVGAIWSVSAAQTSIVCFFALFIIWLKLLVPWRFFRLWSLMDGIDPPENMIRCVANNFSTSSFWRSWHRSFNKWAVRYIYVPLGGSKHKVRNALVTFLFTAMWHDMELRLLVWGLIMVGIVLLEAIGTYLFNSTPHTNYTEFWNVLGNVGCVINIWMMLIGNLIGFAIGVDGAKFLLKRLLTTTDGLKFVVTASIVLYEGTRIMFQIRDNEHARGIDLKF